jgi:hypothetical protein
MIMLGCRALGFRVPAESVLFMLAYVLFLLTIASFVHSHFELPMQRWLRSLMVSRQARLVAFRQTA